MPASGHAADTALLRDTNSGFYPINLSGPAVNNALLMSNNNGLPYGQTGSVYDVNNVQQAKAAADAVSGALGASHITASPEDSTDNVAGIEGKLGNAASQYTVFFAADHGDVAINGNPYVLGDCLAVPTLADVGDWLPTPTSPQPYSRRPSRRASHPTTSSTCTPVIVGLHLSSLLTSASP